MTFSLVLPQARSHLVANGRAVLASDAIGLGVTLPAGLAGLLLGVALDLVGLPLGLPLDPVGLLLGLLLGRVVYARARVPEYLIGPPVMASDDMSLFLKVRPRCSFRVVIAPARPGHYPHHAPEFEMNEDGLPVALRPGLAVMRSALGAAGA